jgi:hypothetical protein
MKMILRVIHFQGPAGLQSIWLSHSMSKTYGCARSASWSGNWVQSLGIHGCMSGLPMTESTSWSRGERWRYPWHGGGNER